MIAKKEKGIARSRMKIAIDVSMLAELRTGTEEYIEGLVWGLSRLGESVVGCGRHGPLLPDKAGLGLPIRAKNPLWRKWWWENVAVRRVSAGMDLLHIPHLSHPAASLTVPTVVTVHDLIPWRLAEYRRRWRDQAYFSHMKKTLPYATALVAISNATYQDIADFFPGLAPKVTVIPNGIHADFFRPVEVALMHTIHDKHGLRRHPRILYLGGYNSRKNVPRLIRSAKRVFDQLKDGELVLVGARGNSDIHRVVQQCGIGDRAILTPYLSRTDVVALYHASDIFVFPSQYEGFGLPPAQALATGLPVIAGDTPAVREVVGDAGIFVDPLDDGEWDDAIMSVLKTPALAQQMVARGRIRAQNFTWEQVAVQYRDLYRHILQG